MNNQKEYLCNKDKINKATSSLKEKLDLSVQSIIELKPPPNSSTFNNCFNKDPSIIGNMISRTSHPVISSKDFEKMSNNFEKMQNFHFQINKSISFKRIKDNIFNDN